MDVKNRSDEKDGTTMAAPSTTGPHHPSPARVYEYLLGGCDYFPPDAAKAEEMLKVHPGLRELARVNRRFVVNAARWTASHLQITQYADLGCGLPLRPSVHSVVREMERGAAVAYVDIDPCVISHVRAAADAEGWGGGIAVIEGDASDPAAVLADPALRGLIDLARPACLIFGGTLSAMTASVAQDAVSGFMAALAPGSAAVISCASYGDDQAGARLAAMFAEAGSWQNHSLQDVAGFFDGLRIVRGRVADVQCWPLLPSGPEKAARVLGGIGVKP